MPMELHPDSHRLHVPDNDLAIGLSNSISRRLTYALEAVRTRPAAR